MYTVESLDELRRMKKGARVAIGGGLIRDMLKLIKDVDKKAEKALRDVKHPVQATKYLQHGDIGGWVKFFQEKGVSIRLHVNRTGNYAIYREVLSGDMAAQIKKNPPDESKMIKVTADE